MIWFALGVVVYAFVGLFLLALCQAAAWADSYGQPRDETIRAGLNVRPVVTNPEEGPRPSWDLPGRSPSRRAQVSLPVVPNVHAVGRRVS